MPKRFFHFAICLSALLILNACDEKESDLGVDLQDPSTLYEGIVDTAYGTAMTVYDDSLLTSGQSSVLVGCYSDAVFGEPSCHPVIAVDVLRHTVDDLHNSLHRAFRLPGNGMDVGISDDGREREFFFQNWHCNNLLNICHRR